MEEVENVWLIQLVFAILGVFFTCLITAALGLALFPKNNKYILENVTSEITAKNKQVIVQNNSL